MAKEKILEIVKKNVNLGGLVADTLDEVLEPALQKVVADSSNPLDDIAMAAIYPVLEKELNKLVEAQINKLFGTDEE